MLKTARPSRPDSWAKTKLKCHSFVFEWVIDGFSNLLERSYEVPSPIFTIGDGNEVQWRLILFLQHKYPEGRHAAVSLMKLTQDLEPSNVRYSFVIIDENDRPHRLETKEKVFTKLYDFIDCTLLSHEKLIKDGFIFDNSIKIQCEMELIQCSVIDKKNFNCPSNESNENNLNEPQKFLMKSSLSCESDILKSDYSLNSDSSLKSNNLEETLSENLVEEKVNFDKCQFNIIPDDTLKTTNLELLSDDLNTLLINKQYSDVTLYVDNVKFRAHKAIICSRSDYFRHICEECKYDVFEFDDIKCDVMENILFYLYTGKLQEVSVELGLNLLHGAKKFRLFHFQQLVIDRLKYDITIENVTDILRHSHDLKLGELKKFCLKFIISNNTEVEKTEKWKRMIKNCPNIAREALSSISSLQKKVHS